MLHVHVLISSLYMYLILDADVEEAFEESHGSRGGVCEEDISEQWSSSCRCSRTN